MDVYPTGDSSTKGLVLSGTLETNIEVYIFQLRNKDNKDKGPSLGYSTRKKANGQSEGAFIETGITIFGAYLGYGKLQYSKADTSGKSVFAVDLVVKADFVKGGEVNVPFELTEKNGKPHLRFTGVPLKDIDNPFSGDALIGKISELTAKDKCGAIDLLKK